MLQGIKRNFKKRLAIFICLTQLFTLIIFTPTANAADPAALPDLIITRLFTTPANPKAEDMVTFSAVVKNQGGPIAANSNFTVGFDFGDGIYYWSGPFTKPLGKNETATIVSTGGSGSDGGKWKVTAGKHNLNSMVDNFADPNPGGYNKVKESNEVNNALLVALNIAADNKPKMAPKAALKPKDQAAGAYYISSDKNEKVDEGIAAFNPKSK